MQSGDENIRHKEEYKLYRSRFYMLAVLAVLNFSNGTVSLFHLFISTFLSIHLHTYSFGIGSITLSMLFACKTKILLPFNAFWD